MALPSGSDTCWPFYLIGKFMTHCLESYEDGYLAGMQFEREACAKVCEGLQAGNAWHGTHNSPKDCAKAIRNRTNEEPKD
jgi:hypothetical protein